MAELKPITQTCTPRSDVLAGGLSDNHFAAQLDQVVRDPGAYPVYGDPTEFFAITYPTAGLRDLLTRTFGRLSGAKVPGAEHGLIRSETDGFLKLADRLFGLAFLGERGAQVVAGEVVVLCDFKRMPE